MTTSKTEGTQDDRRKYLLGSYFSYDVWGFWANRAQSRVEVSQVQQTQQVTTGVMKAESFYDLYRSESLFFLGGLIPGSGCQAC